MLLNFELLRIVIALIGTAILAYQDHKTSFIEEKIVYAMIAIGTILDLLTFDSEFILFSVGGAIVIGTIGYYLYRTGQFGLGDSLLFVGLHALLPFPAIEFAKYINAAPLVQSTAYLQIAQIVPFILSIVITASMLALVGSSTSYAHKLWKSKKPWQPNKIILTISTMVSVGFILFWFKIKSAATEFSIVQFAILAIVFAAVIFAVSTRRQVMQEIIVKELHVSEIEDEDILALENIDKKLVEEYKLEKVLTKNQVEKLKAIQQKTGKKTFPVYKNLPRFVPYVLVSLIIHLLYVNTITLFIFL